LDKRFHREKKKKKEIRIDKLVLARETGRCTRGHSVLDAKGWQKDGYAGRA
jgi:hypothetical protein